MPEEIRKYQTEFICSDCGMICRLKDMRYNPYKKVRVCERCYEINTDRKIYKTISDLSRAELIAGLIGEDEYAKEES